MSDHDIHAVMYEGDPRHPDHERYLLELGRATQAAAQVVGICFDILRVFGQVPGRKMYSDPLGVLESKLASRMRQSPPVPGLADFMNQLKHARQARNDLLHALPVQGGLHRRITKDLWYVRNFYTVADLQQVTAVLSAAHTAGSRVLYHDGGAAIGRWYEAQLEPKS